MKITKKEFREIIEFYRNTLDKNEDTSFFIWLSKKFNLYHEEWEWDRMYELTTSLNDILYDYTIEEAYDNFVPQEVKE